MALVISAVLIYKPSTIIGTPVIASYTAVMESDKSGDAMAVTKIERSSMKLSIDIMKPMYIDDGMELTLWCHPKTGGKPMRMGTISKTGKTELDISEEEYENLKNIGELKVSLEMKGQANITKPSKKILLKGKLSSAE